MNLVHCQGSIYSGFYILAFIYIYILADYSCLQRHSIYARLGSVGGRLPWNRGGRSLSRVTRPHSLPGNRCLEVAMRKREGRSSIVFVQKSPLVYFPIENHLNCRKSNFQLPEIVVSELKESSTIFPPIFVAFFKFPKL